MMFVLDCLFTKLVWIPLSVIGLAVLPCPERDYRRETKLFIDWQRSISCRWSAAWDLAILAHIKNIQVPETIEIIQIHTIVYKYVQDSSKCVHIARLHLQDVYNMLGCGGAPAPRRHTSCVYLYMF